jgi:hypothetical protein
VVPWQATAGRFGGFLCKSDWIGLVGWSRARAAAGNVPDEGSIDALLKVKRDHMPDIRDPDSPASAVLRPRERRMFL